jgi:hypothetical protein
MLHVDDKPLRHQAAANRLGEADLVFDYQYSHGSIHPVVVTCTKYNRPTTIAATSSQRPFSR